jgi:tRNA(Ile)-lysidine synthase
VTRPAGSAASEAGGSSSPEALEGSSGLATKDLLARCTFPPSGSEIALGVSGGRDSLALLVLAVASGCRAVAYHVDHGLRPGSDAEAQVVGAAAARYGVSFVALQATVAPGPNLEARARSARYAVLPPGVATGHTADDQAETILLNLLRGAGPDGLAGMRPGPAHPILGLRRSETHLLCSTLELATVEDPSNTDPSYLRNRIRHEVLPSLCSLAGRDLVPVIARQAQHFAAEGDLLDELASGVDPTDATALAGVPVVLARRAIRRWLRETDPEGHPPSSATVERVLDVAALRSRACETGGGRRVRRSAGRLHMDPG